MLTLIVAIAVVTMGWLVFMVVELHGKVQRLWQALADTNRDMLRILDMVDEIDAECAAKKRSDDELGNITP